MSDLVSQEIKPREALCDNSLVDDTCLQNPDWLKSVLDPILSYSCVPMLTAHTVRLWQVRESLLGTPFKGVTEPPPHHLFYSASWPQRNRNLSLLSHSPAFQGSKHHDLKAWVKTNCLLSGWPFFFFCHRC